MTTDLAGVNRIPSDWGLEVGVLAEVFRNCAVGRVCQVDLADNYDHKHQPLSTEDASRGLRRMSCDIAQSLFRTLAQEGVVWVRITFVPWRCTTCGMHRTRSGAMTPTP